MQFETPSQQVAAVAALHSLCSQHYCSDKEVLQRSQGMCGMVGAQGMCGMVGVSFMLASFPGHMGTRLLPCVLVKLSFVSVPPEKLIGRYMAELDSKLHFAR